MKLPFSVGSLTSGVRRGAHLDPSRDWYRLLALAGVALIIIIGWNIWAFDTVAQGGVLGPAATTTAPVFSRTSLDAIHNVFSNRSDEEAKYVAGTYHYDDPSQ